MGLINDDIVHLKNKDAFSTYIKKHLESLPDQRSILNSGHSLSVLVKNKIPLKDCDNNLNTLVLIDKFLDEIQIFHAKNKNINLFLRRKTSMLQMTSDYLSIYMEMGPDEKDLIIMHHYFIILRPNGTRYKLESTMSIEGKEDFSAMQQTVGLTLGIALEFIVQNKILTDKG